MIPDNNKNRRKTRKSRTRRRDRSGERSGSRRQMMSINIRHEKERDVKVKRRNWCRKRNAVEGRYENVYENDKVQNDKSPEQNRSGRPMGCQRPKLSMK